MLKSGFLVAVVLVIAATIAWTDGGIKDWLSDLSFTYRFGITKKSNIMIPMRDGIRLKSTVYLSTNSKGPVPTILMRTTYGGFPFKWTKFFVDNGYAIVEQQVRGRYGSEGKYVSPHRFSRRDGYDTIDWIVTQPWATGKVGTFGCSYLGENQIMLAAAKHPNHIAMIAGGAGGAIGNVKKSYGYFGVYENGVLNLASALGWFTRNGAIDHDVTPAPPDLGVRLGRLTASLPVATLASAIVPYSTGYDDLVQHSLTDNWWQAEGYIDRSDTFSTAALHVNTWYDQTVHDTVKLAQHMAENSVHPRARNQHLLLGPGLHCSSGKLDEGDEFIGQMKIRYADIGYKNIYLKWFDYWLKSQGELQRPPVQYYLLNSSSWRTAEQWPPQAHETLRLYINTDNRLSYEDSLSGGHSAGQYYEFQYDPNDPVPSLGGPICCTYRDNEIAGAVDQAPLKGRKDVLLFESDSLPEAIDVVGNIRVLLNVSTDAMDTDFTLKIVDQTPGGPAYNLQDGIVRLSYRGGIHNPELSVPGTIYPITLELRPIAYRFRAGHKISIYISSSNFPRLARNLNTGEDSNQSTRSIIANNRVYYAGNQASYVELPITQ